MNRNATAIILIVLGIGIYFTVTRGLLATDSNIRTVNDQYVAAIASAEQLISIRDQARDQYNSISPDDRARLDKMIPSTVDNIRLIIDLNTLALKHGFSLRNVTADVPSASTDSSGSTPVQSVPVASPSSSGDSATVSLSTPTLDTVNVSFGFTTTFDQFMSFLNDIQADLRIMDINHMSVTANDDGTYSVTLNLTTYWLRQ
jgi:Tfp pilus assembly protein PilO